MTRTARTLATEDFAERHRKIYALAMLAERQAPHAPTRELGILLDLEAIDDCNSAILRDLAGWVGAKVRGMSRRDALAEIASAWMTWRALWRSQNPRARARARAMELRRDAYANGRSVADQRAYEERRAAVSDFMLMVRDHATNASARAMALGWMERGLRSRGFANTFTMIHVAA